MTTVPVQTRLPHRLTKALDARVAISGTTRAEVVRDLIEFGLTEPKLDIAMISDPLLDRIADTLGSLSAKVDASLAASRNAHAATKLGMLMLLPIDKQQAFIDKLSKAVQL